MASEEPVTSPDQHRPTISRRLARTGAVFTILALAATIFPRNYEGVVAVLAVLGVAALILFLLIADWLLRKNGLRRE
ncbi:MAG: hypothetical protein ACM30G_12300 [Micromonosporaceae bacterium]